MRDVPTRGPAQITLATVYADVRARTHTHTHTHRERERERARETERETHGDVRAFNPANR